MSATTTARQRPPATLRREGPVGVITLTRPEARNAVDEHPAAAVGKALEVIEHDPSLRVTVVTGAGPAFCAGATSRRWPPARRERARTP